MTPNQKKIKNEAINQYKKKKGISIQEDEREKHQIFFSECR